MNKQDKIVRESIIDSLVKLRMVHVWEKDWYKKKDVREYVSAYYVKIRNIIQTTESRYWELTRCVDCEIYLITSCSNRGREDIRCPFGCRECNKKATSNKRSRAYYKTIAGKKKKQKQNENRYRRSNQSSIETKKSSKEEKGSFLGYLRFILSIIEGRFISWQDINDILEACFKKWSQHPLEYWLGLCNMTA